MTTRNPEKINLLPQEILDQRKYELWYPWIASVAIICLLIIGLLYIGSLIALSAREKEVQAVQAEIEATQKSANSLVKYEKAQKNYACSCRAAALANSVDLNAAWLNTCASAAARPSAVPVERPSRM